MSAVFKKIDICIHVLYSFNMFLGRKLKEKTQTYLFYVLCFILPHIVTSVFDQMGLLVVLAIEGRSKNACGPNVLSLVILSFKANKTDLHKDVAGS